MLEGATAQFGCAEAGNGAERSRGGRKEHSKMVLSFFNLVVGGIEKCLFAFPRSNFLLLSLVSSCSSSLFLCPPRER